MKSKARPPVPSDDFYPPDPGPRGSRVGRGGVGGREYHLIQLGSNDAGRVPRNQPCACGSGKKQKVCCAKKGFKFTLGEQGNVGRIVPLRPEVREILERQGQAFCAKFGREMGHDDPMFFDPDADTPKPVEMDTAEMRREFGEAARGPVSRRSSSTPRTRRASS